MACKGLFLLTFDWATKTFRLCAWLECHWITQVRRNDLGMNKFYGIQQLPNPSVQCATKLDTMKFFFLSLYVSWRLDNKPKNWPTWLSDLYKVKPARDSVYPIAFNSNDSFCVIKRCEEKRAKLSLSKLHESSYSSQNWNIIFYDLVAPGFDGWKSAAADLTIDFNCYLT